MLKPILKPLILALSMLTVVPMAAQAAELTLLPSVKLQIGDRDNSGNYWDGGHWRDHGMEKTLRVARKPLAAAWAGPS